MTQMVAPDVDPGPRAGAAGGNAAAPRPPAWRKAVVWGLAVILIAAAVGWWWASTARLGPPHTAGFDSPNATVVSWDAPGSDSWSILIVEPGATATLSTSLTNEGPFDVRIDGVSTGGPPCFMEVTEARLGDDRETMYVDEGPSVPAVGATIPSGGDVGLFLDLGVPDPPCRNDGIAYRDTIELRATVLGRTQRVTVPLMQTIGQSTDSPRRVADFVDVRISRPDG